MPITPSSGSHPLRIAIVTPYSWTYGGGVNRHVEALAEALIDRGHELRVLAPWDPPDRLSRALHRASAEPRSRPDYLIPLGRTVGYGANGAVSNLSSFPGAVLKMRRELRAGRFDVVHVHEPPAPMLGWDACSFPDAPVVGTFHAYSTKRMPNASPTCSEPAASSTSSTRGSPSPRPPPGPDGAGTGANIASSPTASTSTRRPSTRSRAPTSSGFCSWAGQRSERASRFSCRRSRGWRSTFPRV